MTMNPPADKILCLAHEQDQEPRKSGHPPRWCVRHVDCVRHQSISQIPYDGNYAIWPRACRPGQHDAFIARDAVESEGGES